ncbi:MAG: methyltransferase domain-containing protein [Phycisphaera sp.]|nr:methyltransferase domain-containing protein [Phycisphaera sp.]
MNISADDLPVQYQLRFGKMAAYRDGVWKILCGEFFNRYIPDNAAVLDLGCGWGEFINNTKGVTKYGMDLNPDAASHLNDDVTFVNQDCSTRWPMDDNSLDVVFTSNFLEHLPDKASLNATMDEVYRCLKPEGRIVCMGPNIKVLGGHYWDFYDHYTALTEESLAEGLQLRGFAIDQITERFMPYTMVRRWLPPLFVVKVYLRLRPAWWLLGKQFLVVARKPSTPLNYAGRDAG